MNPISHLLASWCVAESAPRLGRRGRVIVTLAGVAPDLDGFGALPEILTRDGPNPLFWWTDYHHVLAHNAMFAVAASALCFAVARERRVLTALLALGAIHLHFLCDLAGSRGPDGYDWPIPYFYPFSREIELRWSGQWALNAWPNIAITAALLAVVFVLAIRRGYSPVELVSALADRLFVDALRSRFHHETR